MTGLWLQDIESLETIAQDDDTRKLFLRIADMSLSGRIQPFLHELEHDRDLDVETKASLAALATDSTFLHAVEDYVHRTQALH